MVRTPSHKQFCMVPKCEGGLYARGICKSCYAVMHALVMKSKTTWEELIAHKKCTETGRIKQSFAYDWAMDFKRKEKKNGR